jgi:hypothetical protein
MMMMMYHRILVDVNDGMVMVWLTTTMTRILVMNERISFLTPYYGCFFSVMMVVGVMMDEELVLRLRRLRKT